MGFQRFHKRPRPWLALRRTAAICRSMAPGHTESEASSKEDRGYFTCRREGSGSPGCRRAAKLMVGGLASEALLATVLPGQGSKRTGCPLGGVVMSPPLQVCPPGWGTDGPLGGASIQRSPPPHWGLTRWPLTLPSFHLVPQERRCVCPLTRYGA